MDRPHLIIFVPTEVERKLLRQSLISMQNFINFSYKIVETGCGKVNAAQYCALETQSDCSAVVSCGFCGATSEYNLGELVIPSKVIDYSLHSILKEIHNTKRIPAPMIPLVSLKGNENSVMYCGDHWIHSGNLDRIDMEDGPAAFDMESFAVAQVASDQSIPTIVVKMVADIVNDDSPEGQYELFSSSQVIFDPIVYSLMDVVSNLNNFKS